MFVSQIFEECAEILGTTNSEKVFRKISQAVQTLMESGHWTHSTAEVDICTGWDCMSVTLPRGVDTPLAVNVDGSPVYFRNRLFQYHVNKGGQYNPVTWAWDDRGYTATAMEILQPAQLVAVAEVENDVGKVIRVLGSNKNNVPLRSQLENGTPVDGLLVPIHSVNDFPYGVILPDSATVETRTVAIDPLTRFTTATPHTLDSGQGVNIQNITGTIPVPLSNGQVLYIGVIDAVTIQLFNDQNNAKNGNYPLALQSIVNAGTLQIKDSKPSAVQTALRFGTAPSIGIGTANPVAFPPQTLPIGLKEKVTYFANLLDPTNIQIFESFEDAQNNTNPVFTTGSTAPIQIDIRKEILPESKLTFAIRHYFSDGDQVQAYTSGGSLPSPLVANQNYFVNVIDDFSISLHETQADAQASTPQDLVNPIRLIDSGSGSNFIVKLIPSIFRSGESAQVTAPGLNIAAPTGSGASFQAVVTGSVRQVQVTNQGSGYTTVPSVTFSPPPTPPVGSNQQAVTAEGYAIINTVSNKVEQVIITNPGLGYTSAPAVTIDPAVANPVIVNVNSINRSGQVATVVTATNHGFTNGQIITIAGALEPEYNIQAPITVQNATTFTYTVAGSPTTPATANPAITATFTAVTGQATATATIQTSFVSYFTKISGGSNYTQSPQVEIVGGGGTGATATAVVNNTTLPLVSMSEVAGVATATTSTPHGFDVGTSVQISGTTPAIYNGTKTVVSVPVSTISGLTITRTGSTAEATTPTNHNYSTGQVVTIAGANLAVYNGQKTIVVTAANKFTYTVTGSPANPTGTITSSIPDPAGVTFTFAVTAGTGNATAVGTVFSGEVLALNIVTAGTGYTSAPNVILTPSTGVFVEFSSTGTLPSPLVAGTAYRAEAPLDGSQGVFTIRNADFSKVNLLGGGSGTLYTVLSRTFGIDFTNRWIGDFSSLATGQEVYFASDFILPTTTPAIDPSTPRYLRIVSTTVATAYTSQANAIAGGTTGLIDVSSFGVGQAYYGLRYTVSPLPYQNLIIPDSVAYLQEDEIVRFSTSGTSAVLPTPLVSGTDYKIKLVGNGVQVYTTGGSLVSLTSAGVGQLSLDIERIVTPQVSTKILCDRSLFETGQSVTVRAASGDSLPNGLVAGTTYYVRRIDENSFELYDTAANAKGTGTTGRREYRTPGSTVDSTFFVDAVDEATFVKSISQIEKPLTDGYVSLYAWDYGRSNDMTLIGHYHPAEVNPQYRRIRIGKPCAWVRLAYRVSPPFITSMYDYIPVEHERAIIAAIHAVDMEDKDFAEQSARYWGIAFQYLKNQQEYIDGHAMVPPQINNITYGDGTDPVIF